MVIIKAVKVQNGAEEGSVSRLVVESVRVRQILLLVLSVIELCCQVFPVMPRFLRGL